MPSQDFYSRVWLCGLGLNCGRNPPLTWAVLIRSTSRAARRRRCNFVERLKNCGMLRECLPPASCRDTRHIPRTRSLTPRLLATALSVLFRGRVSRTTCAEPPSRGREISPNPPAAWFERWSQCRSRRQLWQRRLPRLHHETQTNCVYLKFYPIARLRVSVGRLWHRRPNKIAHFAWKGRGRGVAGGLGVEGGRHLDKAP